MTDTEKLASFEKTVSSMQMQLQDLQERIEKLEQQAKEQPAPQVPTASPIDNLAALVDDQQYEGDEVPDNWMTEAKEEDISLMSFEDMDEDFSDDDLVKGS